jgi:hypothetical protein
LPLSLTIETVSKRKEVELLSMANVKRISANSEIMSSKELPNSNRELSQKWIRENRKEYSGKWVVLHGDRLLASANSSKELVENIDLREGKDRFITVVY